MTFKKTFFRSVANVATFTYISQAIEFFSTIILSRLLLPKEYGFVAIITLFSGFVQLFADNGIFQALIRSDFKYTYHRMLFNLSIWIGLLLTIVQCIFAYPISIIFNDPELFIPTMILSLRFLFDSINYVPVAIQIKELKFTQTGYTKLITTAFTIALSIIMAYFGFSYWALIIPNLISPLVQFAGHYYYTHFGIKMYSITKAYHTLKSIKKLMGNMTLNNTIGYWTNNADKVIIGKIFTQSDLGLYNRAFRFQDITNKLISAIFSNVLFPSMKKLQETGGNLQKEYFDILGIITIINFPIYAILILLPKQIVLMLWGNDWITVADYVPFVGIMIMFYSIRSTFTNIFLLYEKEGILTKITVATSVINVISAIWGSLYSMKDVLVFLTFSNVAINMPLFIYFGFYRSFRFDVGHIIKFWSIKLITGTGLILSLEFGNFYSTIVLLTILFVHLLWYQRANLKTVFVFSTKFLKRKE